MVRFLPGFVNPAINGSDWTAESFCDYVRYVPNVPKGAGANSPAKAAALPFEEALKTLDDVTLETLLAKYEEGTRLARDCQERLADAELKVQQLEPTAAGEPKIKPFAPEAGEGA